MANEYRVTQGVFLQNNIIAGGKPLVGFSEVVPPSKKTIKQTIFLYSDNTYEVK